MTQASNFGHIDAFIMKKHCVTLWPKLAMQSQCCGASHPPTAKFVSLVAGYKKNV